MNKNRIYVICFLQFLIFTFCYAKEISQVYDLKGNIKTLEEISENKPLIIVFFSTYTCISCNEELNAIFDSLCGKYNLKVILIGRLKGKFDILDAYEQKNIIKKYFPDYQLYFDIHNSTDIWPPKNLKGGLFQFYKVEKFPAILFFNKGLKEFVSYDKLFPEEKHNNLISTIEEKIRNIFLLY
jgi:thioredoxin-related protein